MSDAISALIAFVGFLVVFSMLAQAVQEALKSAFKLKAGVWERFLLALYKDEFRAGGTQTVKPASFWQRVKSGEFIGDFDTRLKRLKEGVVKADELLQAVKKALHDIATLSLNKPSSSSLLMPRTQELAVRLKELTGLKLDSLLTTYDRFDANAITGVANALRAFQDAYPDLGHRIKEFDDKTAADLQQKSSDLLNAIAAAEKKISDYRRQIEYKMDAWIAQVNEEYRRNMLKWTVVTGFLLVVLFNADSFSIYKYLSADSKAQALIVQKALESTPKEFRAAVGDLNGIEASLRDGDAEKAKKAMDEFSASLEDDFRMFGANDGATAAAALRTRLGYIKPGEGDKGLSLLKELAGELARMYAALHKAAIAYQFEGVASLELPLGWTEDWRRFKSAAEQKSGMLLPVLTKIGGLLLTTFLITFGAPFWNDILSALFGLKNSFKK